MHLPDRIRPDDGRENASRIFAAANHDLRQPIQALRLFVGVLARTPLPKEGQRLVGLLGASVTALTNIVNEMLEVSRLECGAIVPRIENVDATAVIAELECEFSPCCLERQLRLQVFYPKAPLRLKSDRRLLIRMLRSLLDNAVRYTGDGGILIGVRKRGNRAAIQIWDSGIGICTDDGKHVFEAFFQVANPERNPDKGLGLGLSLAQRIAALLDCRLSFRSKPQRGSMFEVLIPLADGAAERDSSATVPPGAGASISGIRVALVEDNRMVRNAMVAWLSAEGAEVASFASAETALADPRLASVDAVISDLQLREAMNGLDFLRQAKAQMPPSAVAILMTANHMSPSLEEARRQSILVLLKPVPPEALLRALCAGRAAAG